MTLLAAALRRMSAALDSSGHRYALVGGLAASVRSEPRMTRDADFAVAVSDDADAEALIAALRTAGFVASTVVEQVATDRPATVRLEHASNPGLLTDLLFSSSGIEREIVASADQMDVMEDVALPVASVGHLIAMKLLARDDRHRPNDADDLRSLAEVATEGDWSAAAEAVTLIEARGFNRGRDLKSALSALRSDGAY